MSSSYRLIEGAVAFFLPRCAYCKKTAPKCTCGKSAAKKEEK